MNIVVTGSTKGIGLGLAREFLQRGNQVVISSRGQAAVDAALAELSRDFPADRMVGQPCDVSDYDQVTALWDKAVEAFGSVDIWVNNAGRDGIQKLFHELPPEDYVATVETNLIGLMHCNHVAIGRMRAQGHGRVFNMEGFGSDGATMPKYGPYGATKYALRYFTKVLVKENKDAPVDIFYLSPGMVITDMLASEDIRQSPDWERKRRIYNILADRVDTVTPWLADGILAAKENGEAVRWLTTPKVIWRFLSSRFRKRDIMTPLGM
ncbi:MAG: SDR family oxidoreductase [Gammaproteobacteria bacterium]|jgi:NAD(P)-dependent dehydrogenase (short-subunit alcohol dehydrogenase family)|nr:SDR family oxidoreductase [Gammaproteobacteria bacterium]